LYFFQISSNSANDPKVPPLFFIPTAVTKAFTKLRGAVKESIKEFKLLLANILISANWAKGILHYQ